jgi:phosphopantothenoylcysteine decarboxylase/phosphopantothenate--cysteine ligase
MDVARVETAEQMARAVFERYPSADAVVMTAAVADFRPSSIAEGKLKKGNGLPEIELVPTTDILATLGKKKEGQVLVGFAAETADLEPNARRKLAEKNLDLIVANQVGEPGTGFGSDTNRAAILGSTGDDIPLREWTKRELAAAICDRIAALLGERRS